MKWIVLKKSTERFSNGMNALAENEVMAHPAVKNAVAEHLRNAIHPTTMATGMISMFAGDEIMSVIKLNCHGVF